MIDWITAKITCTHNPEILSSGRSIRTKKLMVLSVWNTKLATVWSFLALMMQILLSAPIRGYGRNIGQSCEVLAGA